MKYRVEISPEAQKEIKSLSGYVRSPVLRLLHSLSTNPRPSRARELQGKSGIYRVWVLRKWRLVYKVEEDTIRVLVLRVRKKEDIDYESI